MTSQAEEPEPCNICQMPMTNSSTHRVVSLRCGHIFGRGCIETWIRMSLASRSSKCPLCKRVAKLKDIRDVYNTFLTLADRAELDEANRQIEDEKKKIDYLTINVSTIQHRLKLNESECDEIKMALWREKEKNSYLSSLNKNKSEANCAKKPRIEPKSEPFAHLKDIDLHPGGGCRLVTYSAIAESLIVSQPSQYHNVKGFGVRKVNIHNLIPNNFIVLHEKKISDIKINDGGILLSCSFDKTIKLTNLCSGTPFLSYSLPIEPWSVEFNPIDQHQFFVGLRNGKIVTFDLRMINRFLEPLQKTSGTPVVALNYINLKENRQDLARGLLYSSLDSYSFYERLDSTGNGHFRMIPIFKKKGKYISAHFDQNTGFGLLSCSPSSHHYKTTHLLLEFSCTSGISGSEFTTSTVKKFEGAHTSVFKPKAKIFAQPGSESSALICAGDESISGAFVWDAVSGSCLQKLSTEEEGPFLDMCLVQNTQKSILSALTNTGLRVYKYSC